MSFQITVSNVFSLSHCSSPLLLYRVDVFLPVEVHLVPWLWVMVVFSLPDKETMLTSFQVKRKLHCRNFSMDGNDMHFDVKPMMHLCRCGPGCDPERSETHQWHSILRGCQGLCFFKLADVFLPHLFPFLHSHADLVLYCPTSSSKPSLTSWCIMFPL